jgi:hypothetical protein
LAALAPGLSAKEVLFRAVIVQHLMKAAVTLSHDASVSDRNAAILEFQRVMQHYLEDMMAAARGEPASETQRGAASKERSSAASSPKTKAKGKPGV